MVLQCNRCQAILVRALKATPRPCCFTKCSGTMSRTTHRASVRRRQPGVVIMGKVVQGPVPSIGGAR